MSCARSAARSSAVSGGTGRPYAGRDPGHERLGEQLHVVLASRSGGSVSATDVEPVVQVLAETRRPRRPRRRSTWVAAMTRTSIWRPACPPTRRIVRRLQRPEQLRLELERQRRRSRRGTACRRAPARTGPACAAIAPVNAPRSCPNSSLSSRFAGIAAQLISTNGAGARGLSIVNRPGQELLAGAGLAPDQHRHVADARATRAAWSSVCRSAALRPRIVRTHVAPRSASANRPACDPPGRPRAPRAPAIGGARSKSSGRAK